MAADAFGFADDASIVTITINPVNDAPMNSVPGAQSTDEDTTLMLDDGTTWSSNGLSVDDPDGDALTLTLSVAHGTLSLSQTTGLTFTTGDGTSDAMMTFRGSIADLNRALVRLRYDPAPNFNGSDTLTLSTDDGTSSGLVDTVAITVNAVNDAPVAKDDSYSTAFGTTLSVDKPGVLSNDTDLESNALSVVDADGAISAIDPVTAPKNGTLVLRADGSFTYTPGAVFVGDDSFAYRASDGQSVNSLSQTATVSIRVAANVPPVAVNDNASTSEDRFVDINVLANDTDAEKSTLRVSSGSIADVRGGTATLQANGKTVRFTPALNANDGNTPGGFGFSYKTNDGTLDSLNTATVTVNVTPVNDAPVVTSITITPRRPVTYRILTATPVATDVDNDSLTFSFVWRKNGVVIPNERDKTLDLSKPGNGDEGDRITVSVVAFDGTTNSHGLTSGNVTVYNFAPPVVSVSPQGATDKVGDKRTFVLTASDPNGASDLTQLSLLTNEKLDTSGGAFLRYDIAGGLLSLQRDDQFLPGIN